MDSKPHCPVRQHFLGLIVGAEYSMEEAISERIVDPPVDALSALRMLAMFLCGGEQTARERPAELLTMMLRIAFDPHFSPTESFRFGLAEIRSALFRIQGSTVGPITHAQARQILGPLSPTDIASALIVPTRKSFSIATKSTRTHTTQNCDFHGLGKTTRIVETPSSITTVVGRSQPSRWRDQKIDDELRASEVFAAGYAALRNAQIGEITPGTNREDDVVIGGIGRIQVVRALPEGLPGMAARGAGVIGGTDREYCAKLLKTIRGKTARYASVERQGLVLLLDGAPIPVPTRVLRDFARFEKRQLASTGFREIWYTSTADSMAFCLWPGPFVERFEPGCNSRSGLELNGQADKA